MSRLLENKAYGLRDENALREELNTLTEIHLEGCPPYRLIWPQWKRAEKIEAIPFVHVQAFKHVAFRTKGGPSVGRVLHSSSTSGSQPSQVFLDNRSSELQSKSTTAIFKDFLGEEIRPLLVLDDSRSLISRGSVSARVAAALSLRPLSQSLHFLLENAADPCSIRWDTFSKVLDLSNSFLLYGFTWILWQSWQQTFPEEIADKLKRKKISFVHSGGWKKLEDQKVDRTSFDTSLLKSVAEGSLVLDFYGLVEQVGVVFPLCAQGFRHVPVWADILIRDSRTLVSPEFSHTVPDFETGQIQLLNLLALGGPYHSVLTEDLGRIVPGTCPCGRSGKRFELLGRVPNSELRGCANV